MTPEHYEAHLECNIFKMKNPTVVGFTTRNSDNSRANNAIWGGVVDFTKWTLIPSYLVELMGIKDHQWAMKKFNIEDKFPSVVLWSNGELIMQATCDDLSTLHSGWILNYLRSALDFVIERGDIKAYRLQQMYEQIKKEGGIIGGEQVSAPSWPL